ncbi:MAG: alpha-L-fucosidase, partial [bacterium]
MRYWLGIIFIIGALQTSARAQITPEQYWPDAQKPKRAEKSKADQDKMSWWREARFGMFIHWNMASLVGAEMSWGKDFTDGDSLHN